MGISYSVEVEPDRSAKAMLRERPMSHKHSKEIAREIKGMRAGEAVSYLERVVAEEVAVPFKSHNSGVGHRKNLDGWDAGRFPKKASEAFLDLLENGIGNADHQGFEGEEMTIVHVAAHKVGESPGRKPRAMGRATEWNTPLVDVELVLESDEALDEIEVDEDDEEETEVEDEDEADAEDEEDADAEDEGEAEDGAVTEDEAAEDEEEVEGVDEDEAADSEEAVSDSDETEEGGEQ
jgi:large subunit ribosomal protein L22